MPAAAAPRDASGGARLDELGAPVSAADPPKDRAPRRGLAGLVIEQDGVRVGLLPVTARPQSRGGAGAEQRTITDGSGAFAFPLVEEGEYLVRTEATDLYESAAALVRAGSDSTVVVVARKAVDEIHLRGVVDSARGPLAGVRVDVVGAQAQPVLSDGTGAYALRVPAGERLRTAVLRFRHAGYREHRLPLAGVDRVTEREWVGDARLEPLAALVPVVGVVRGADGRAVERATVQLESAERRQSYRAVTDPAGRFQFGQVEEGSGYTLWVRPRAAYKDELREDLTVGERGATLAVVLQPLGVASLRGRMVDSDGVPLPGFTLTLTAAYGSAARAVPVTGDAAGRFAVENLPEGPVALTSLAAPRIAISGIDLAADVVREVTLPIGLGAHRVEGRVVSASGVPVGGALVSMQWSSSAGGVVSRCSRDTVTDTNGSFAFTGVGSGMHTVAVRAAGFSGTELRQPVGAGSQPVEIRLRGNR